MWEERGPVPLFDLVAMRWVGRDSIISVAFFFSRYWVGGVLYALCLRYIYNILML